MRCLNFTGFCNFLAGQIFARKDFDFSLVSWASEKLRNYHILEIPIQHLRDYLLGIGMKNLLFCWCQCHRKTKEDNQFLHHVLTFGRLRQEWSGVPKFTPFSTNTMQTNNTLVPVLFPCNYREFFVLQIIYERTFAFSIIKYEVWTLEAYWEFGSNLSFTLVKERKILILWQVFLQMLKWASFRNYQILCSNIFNRKCFFKPKFFIYFQLLMKSPVRWKVYYHHPN